jgi:hypothetical protein
MLLAVPGAPLLVEWANRSSGLRPALLAMHLQPRSWCPRLLQPCQYHSNSKLLALVGYGSSMPMLLIAAGKLGLKGFTPLQADSTESLRGEVANSLRAVQIYGHLVKQLTESPSSGVRKTQQHERLVHLLMPALLLQFAAQQATQQAHQRFPCWELYVSAAMCAITAARNRGAVCGHGRFEPVPEDLRQVLLQDLLPLVVQISSAVLGLPGPAAYRGFGSGSTQISQMKPAPASPDLHVTGYNKFAIPMSLMECLCFAAYPSFDGQTPYVPAAALGAHVLGVAQLFEAAVRQLYQGAHDAVFACTTLGQVCRYVGTFCCVSSSGPGALLRVAGDGAAAHAAGVSAEQAQLQLASLCCSLLKAGCARAAAPGADSRNADRAIHTVAAALTIVTASMSAADGSPFHDWQADFTALGVAWLHICGRVLLYSAARLANTTAGVTPGTPGTSTSAASGVSAFPASALAAEVPRRYVTEFELLQMPSLQELQMVCLVLCHNMRTVLTDPSASEQLAAAGCDAVSLQQQLDVFLLSLPEGIQIGALDDKQLAALRSLGAALTSQAFPCACNNPACGQLAGALELQLVNRHSCLCADCRVARYCGRDCQRRHWKQHKPGCRVIAAAQANAATAQSETEKASL